MSTACLRSLKDIHVLQTHMYSCLLEAFGRTTVWYRLLTNLPGYCQCHMLPLAYLLAVLEGSCLPARPLCPQSVETLANDNTCNVYLVKTNHITNSSFMIIFMLGLLFRDRLNKIFQTVKEEFLTYVFFVWMYGQTNKGISI